ncbi:hypothetical protein OID55_10975 [Streptomyces sp. NBC_00715]|uniref:hypothetical protein n=1 Tax=Streptomyces sp. NBC_00715 TaxID=2975811 RepID=UPI0038632C2A
MADDPHGAESAVRPSLKSKLIRDGIREAIASGETTEAEQRPALALFDLVDRYGATPADPGFKADFLGLGEVRVMWGGDNAVHHEAFLALDVQRTTGVTSTEWRSIRDDELDQAARAGMLPRVSSFPAAGSDGTPVDLWVCNWEVALRMALAGPWGAEIKHNVSPALRLASRSVGITTRHRLYGIDLNMDAPVPSPEVAEHQVHAGPFDALRWDLP